MRQKGPGEIAVFPVTCLDGDSMVLLMKLKSDSIFLFKAIKTHPQAFISKITSKLDVIYTGIM